MEKLKENLENQNGPKLLYRLDKRKPLYILFEFVFFAIFLFVMILMSFVSLFSLVVVFIILHYMYYLLLFDYIEIYENKIIYKNLLGIKQIILANDLLKSFNSSVVTDTIMIFKSGKFYNKFIPYIIVSSLSTKQSVELEKNIFTIEIHNLNKKDKQWKKLQLTA